MQMTTTPPLEKLLVSPPLKFLHNTTQNNPTKWGRELVYKKLHHKTVTFVWRLERKSEK